MNEQPNEETAYAFCLDAIKHSYFYYRTVSLFSGKHGDHGRDRREAYPVVIINFAHIFKVLNQPFRWVRNEVELAAWLIQCGWALMPKTYAKQRVGDFLGSRTCVASAIGLFWDVDLPRNRAASRRISSEVRQKVLDRDKHRCIECGRAESDGAALTMDHVIPFSRGGETAAGNLVTLCTSCNQSHGNEAHPHLFPLAGLDHDWDPQLLDEKVNSNPDARTFAMMLSKNIMVTRVKKWTALSEMELDE